MFVVRMFRGSQRFTLEKEWGIVVKIGKTTLLAGRGENKLEFAKVKSLRRCRNKLL